MDLPVESGPTNPRTEDDDDQVVPVPAELVPAEDDDEDALEEPEAPNYKKDSGYGSQGLLKVDKVIFFLGFLPIPVAQEQSSHFLFMRS